MKNHNFYMNEALKLAKIAFQKGEIPVGAVIVKNSTGKIVGKGYNLRESSKSPLAHAEVMAIKEASQTLGGWRLLDCTIYVTLEPCPMCCGAIINSRIEKVVFGAYDKKSGCCSSVMNMFEFPFNHKPKITSGILRDDCSKILSDFFSNLRKSKSKRN